MPPVASKAAQVLVTGANGFLGAHVARAFIARGYKVRGTVRSPASGEFLRELYDKQYPDQRGKFSWIVVEDMVEPGAFDEAVHDVDAIAHTASPFAFLPPGGDPDILVRPAVQGTVGVLKSAKEYGSKVRRVIVTSSVAAIDEPREPGYTYTPADWNNHSINEVKTKGKDADSYEKYCASKTLAELELWNFLKQNKGGVKFDGVTTNTPYLYGPVINEINSLEQLNTSTKKLWSLLADPLPHDEGALTDWVGDHLDVRDIAEAQVDAITREGFAGHRLLMANGPLTRQDVLDAYHKIASSLPQLPFKVPRGDPGSGDSKRKTFYRFSSEESERLLGWQFRQLPETLKDTLWSLKDNGMF